MTELAFAGLVLAVALQRLAELRRSRRNERRLIARGAREHARGQMAWMTSVHTAWLVAMPLEVLLLGRPFVAPLAAIALLLFLAGQALRHAAIRGLGEHWTVRVVTVPGAPVVTRGIYQWIRHPNYLGVVLEIAALPLVHTAWITSAVLSAANGLVIARRIRAEERALARDTGYGAAFSRRPRWLPRRAGRG